MRICPNCKEKTEFKFCPTDGFPTVELKDVQGESSDPLIGTMFAEKYRVEKILGKGGMGTVYKALNVMMEQKVAIKLLKKELASDLTAVKRFFQEARVVSKLSHPNTIKVYDFGRAADGYLYIAMEFIDGKPLFNVIANESPFSAERVFRITSQMLKALGEAHKNGIVHRDLKPENIFLCEIFGEKEFVKVLDFGIAKLKGPDSFSLSLTATGNVIGTPYYMSPEQAEGKKVDHKTDIYAAGVMMYEMLSGSLPFDGESIPTILLKHVSAAPPPFESINPNLRVPDELKRIIFQMMEKNPDARPDSCEEIIMMLERAMSGRTEPVQYATQKAPGPDMTVTMEHIPVSKKKEEPVRDDFEIETGAFEPEPEPSRKSRASKEFHKEMTVNVPSPRPEPVVIEEKAHSPTIMKMEKELKPQPLKYIAIGIGVLCLIAVIFLGIKMFGGKESGSVDNTIEGKQKTDGMPAQPTAPQIPVRQEQPSVNEVPQQKIEEKKEEAKTPAVKEEQLGVQGKSEEKKKEEKKISKPKQKTEKKPVYEQL
jgi:serine/threonine protein kinase